MSDIERLLEPMIPALRRYSRALLRDQSASDDLVQDCLERAIAHWGQRRTDGNPRAWVFAILQNLFKTRMRRIANRAPDVALEDADESAIAVAAPQVKQLLYKETLGALAKLPEDQRAVLLLVAVEDLSYAEAAKVLGVPIGTVMSRLSRARERLLALTTGEARPDTAQLQLRIVK
ncbi:MAG: sigma-70 family RNA polymerase sigma factor [Beijerinckiaceae bacterium]|jgi:RNA polymerase sigma-70 factor (ECF subfamily)